jgi:hypothetical protein
VAVFCARTDIIESFDVESTLLNRTDPVPVMLLGAPSYPDCSNLFHTTVDTSSQTHMDRRWHPYTWLEAAISTLHPSKAVCHHSSPNTSLYSRTTTNAFMRLAAYQNIATRPENTAAQSKPLIRHSNIVCTQPSHIFQSLPRPSYIVNHHHCDIRSYLTANFARPAAVTPRTSRI